MSEPQMYAPDYLRGQSDKQLHLIAEMIEKQIDKISDLQAKLTALQVSLDAGKDEAALKWADEYYPDSKMWDSKDGNAYQGFLAGWSAKPTRPLTELTAGELLSHPLVRELVDSLDFYTPGEFPWSPDSEYDNGSVAEEALKPFRGEDENNL